MTRDEVSAIIKQADCNCSGKLDYNKVLQTLILFILVSLAVLALSNITHPTSVCWPIDDLAPASQLPTYWNTGWWIFLFPALYLVVILEKVTCCT